MMQKVLKNCYCQGWRKRPGTRDTEAEEEEAEAGVMTDVQSCLDYIDGLLATPSMIDIPRTEVSH